MKCHYCDLDAIYAAESDGVRVGLCEHHLHERLEEIQESLGITELGDVIEKTS